MIDTGWRLNFPNRHPHAVRRLRRVEESDCVLFVDVKDMGKWTQKLDRTTREIESLIPADAAILDIGFNELGIGAWSHDHAQLHETDLQVTADTAVALPLLLDLCRELNANERAGWRRRLTELPRETWAGWARRGPAATPASPRSRPRGSRPRSGRSSRSTTGC